MHYNGRSSYLFLNGIEIYKFKAKDSETFLGPICLGNISKDWLVDNVKKTGFNVMILVLIMILSQLLILKIFISIWWRKIIFYSMYKMFRFILKVFYIGSLFLSSLASTTPLSCISMNNQACKIRPEIINVNY